MGEGVAEALDGWEAVSFVWGRLSPVGRRLCHDLWRSHWPWRAVLRCDLLPRQEWGSDGAERWVLGRLPESLVIEAWSGARRVRARFVAARTSRLVAGEVWVSDDGGARWWPAEWRDALKLVRPARSGGGRPGPEVSR